MARKKIREYDAKRLISEHLLKYSNNQLSIPFQTILITKKTNLNELPKIYPWLSNSKLVCKPDQLFGKRKKYNLVLLNATYDETKRWLKQHQNKETTVGKATDKLTHFIIEPYLSHQEEFYLSITSERDNDIILFSAQGGMDIEERWNTIKTIEVPTLETISTKQIEQLLPKELSEEKKQTIIIFIKAIHQIYINLNFSSLEINPFALTNNNQIALLDLVAEIDDCAFFKNQKEWGALEFPTPFGKKISAEEAYIEKIDQESGASLKLTILNQNGRIWNILSGGGASVIYLDTLVSQGVGQELANYGEYSGNPTTQESYQYAKTILQLMTKEVDPKGKVLIIAGAIANFTDIEKTFKGIIQAIKEYKTPLQKGKISIFVRRGGPNDKIGLELMKQAGKELNISIEVFGPETPMTAIVPLVIKNIKT